MGDEWAMLMWSNDPLCGHVSLSLPAAIFHPSSPHAAERMRFKIESQRTITKKKMLSKNAVSLTAVCLDYLEGAHL